MPTPFENRIREATVVPRPELIGALNQATKNAASELGSREALDLVRIVHYRPLDEGAKAQLRTRFNRDQVVIADQGQDQMLATLGAITLIRVFDRPQYSSGLLPALAVRAALSQGWNVVHPDVRTHAVSYLSERDRIVRAPKAPDDFEFVPKEGETAEPMDEIRAMREALLEDRSLRTESDRLLWWLASRDRPGSNHDAAIEFAGHLHLIPEPSSSADLLRMKLERVEDLAESNLKFEIPAVSNAVADFCPELLGTRKVGALDVEKVHVILNEILLLRALTERPLDQ